MNLKTITVRIYGVETEYSNRMPQPHVFKMKKSQQNLGGKKNNTPIFVFNREFLSAAAQQSGNGRAYKVHEDVSLLRHSHV